MSQSFLLSRSRFAVGRPIRDQRFVRSALVCGGNDASHFPPGLRKRCKLLGPPFTPAITALLILQVVIRFERRNQFKRGAGCRPDRGMCVEPPGRRPDTRSMEVEQI